MLKVSGHTSFFSEALYYGAYALNSSSQDWIIFYPDLFITTDCKQNKFNETNIKLYTTAHINITEIRKAHQNLITLHLTL